MDPSEAKQLRRCRLVGADGPVESSLEATTLSQEIYSGGHRSRVSDAIYTALRTDPVESATMSAGGRIRDPPNGTMNGPQRPPRFQENGAVRGASGSSVPRSELQGAERFEDEKKRIIESCFSKKDAEGSCQYSC